MKAVLGLGNALKQDDNIGNIIATELQGRIEDVRFFVAGTAPESFLHQIKTLNPSILFILDAAEFDGELGDIRLLSLEEISERKASTHNIPMSFFEKFLPGELKVIGIKVKSTAFGMGLSSEIKDQVPALKNKVLEIITQD
ncbi:MAG: hydrogenase maturation protease [Candidatus Woesearchaeota archaeon]